MKRALLAVILSCAGLLMPAWALFAHGGEEVNTTNTLVSSLCATNQQTRETAARLIIDMGNVAVPLMRGVLQNTSQRNYDTAFREAVSVLEHIGTDEALKEIVAVIDYNVSGVPNVLMKNEDRVRAAYPAYASVISAGKGAASLLREELLKANGERKDLISRALQQIEAASSGTEPAK